MAFVARNRGRAQRVRRSAALFVAAAALTSACVGSNTPEGAERSDPGGPRVSLGADGRPEWLDAACSLPLEQLRRIRNGFFPGRSPDVMFVPQKRTFFNGQAHSAPYRHIQEVPFVLYGPGFIPPKGEISVSPGATSADLAHTFAELVGFDLPSKGGRRAISEALVPATERAEPPRLIVTVVWDGGGSNVLRRWPDEWPNLRDMVDGGVAVKGATLGAAPSVTPPVHATIGTGRWPRDHGIVDLNQRQNGAIVDSYEGKSPDRMRVPTLADLYDGSLGNEPKIGLVAESPWHLGMIGHGSSFSGGDKDIAVLLEKESYGELFTNPDLFSLPPGLVDEQAFRQAMEQVDLEDGRRDGLWMENDLLQDTSRIAWTPAWGIRQTDIIEQLLTDRGFGRDDVPDLFYTNYKQIDHAAHRWTLNAPEMGAAVRYSDRALGQLIEALDRIVGRGNWVIALTADHGSQPAIGWEMGVAAIAQAAAEHFGVEPEDLMLAHRPSGLWLDREFAAAQGIASAEVASFINGYTLGQDLEESESGEGGSFSGFRRRDRLFVAAFPSAALPQIWKCALEKRVP
jgi:hypothetical protein